MFSTRTSYFMKSPDSFVLSLICRANIFSLGLKLFTLEIAAKTTTRDKCKFNCVRLNLIWYHFILNLEIRAWNLYFLHENVLHLNNKNTPCFLTRIIDFLSPKVAALLFVNSQISVFAFAKISRTLAIDGKTNLIRFLTKSFHIVRDFADFQKLCGIVRLWSNRAVPHPRTLSEGLSRCNNSHPEGMNEILKLVAKELPLLTLKS